MWLGDFSFSLVVALLWGSAFQSSLIHILPGYIEQLAFDAVTLYSSAKGQRRKHEKCNWYCKSRSNMRKLHTENGPLLETIFLK